MKLNPTLRQVTDDIEQRSKALRNDYLERMQRAASDGPSRQALSCGNLAHGFAACGAEQKQALSAARRANVAIITAYNDMLSAHQPYHRYPEILKSAAWQAGGVAQVAGGVPAMCDGVTQGQPGMELSLFSRDVIAMATAISLSHNMFDSVLMLGICDKIVPGLLIGALSFGHLPALMVPAGPMPSGLSNAKKAKVRQLYAEGKIGREELLASESQAYHSAGTCTFYGTANTNQLLMEFMGLQLPGSSFVNPGTPLREALTRAVAARAVTISRLGSEPTPLCEILDARAIVNGIVGLLASGGSTNHTLHLVAIARAAGTIINWEDFNHLSAVVPLLARVYPNGKADVNHFHAAGGIQFLIRELLDSGLLHPDVKTVAGQGLQRYTREAFIDQEAVEWREGATVSHDTEVLRAHAEPFEPNGGLALLEGNLGRAVIKISAVKAEHRLIEAPARVFARQEQVQAAFQDGQLDGDVVVVMVHQGPQANGMPELHKLTPILGVLQDRGQQVALVTDGRMSGASGKVPAAIHLTPEASAGGPLAKLRDGDLIRLDASAGRLDVQLDDTVLANRSDQVFDLGEVQTGFGRELFANFRSQASPAEEGASLFRSPSEVKHD